MSLQKVIPNEKKVLDCLKDNIYGNTVMDISKITNLSRNTVYRYLAILEGKNCIFKRKIGGYKLYFSKEGRQVSPDIVSGYYKGLLSAIKDEIPLNPVRWQRFGKKIAKYLKLPHEKEDMQKLVNIRFPLNESDIDMLNSMKPYFSLLHDKLELKKIYSGKVKGKMKVIFYFIDSDLLEEDRAYIFHFYILCGFIEEKFKEYLNMNVDCDVLDYKVRKEDDENYIKISLEIV